MSTMLTFRAGKFAALAVSLVCLGACSREQQDWRSAEASDTVEDYARFLKQHPDSELVTQARTRVAQLSEDREWQRAGETDSAEAYKQFLAQHPNGKWAQEARIRIENFALGAAGAGAAGAAVASSGVTSGAAADGAAVSGSAVRSPGDLARGPSGSAPMAPGEAAQPLASAQALPGEAAQVPTSPIGSAQVLTSQTTTPTQTPSALGTAWRPSDNGSASYGVQLGAFASENAATSQWQQLTARFSAQLRGLAPHVVSADTTTGRLFRLQALVADEATARTLCDMLKKQSQACVPVLPH
jgi:cell division septation protein DedD